MSTIVIEKLIVSQLVEKLVIFKGILYPQNFKLRIADTSETAKFNPHHQYVFFFMIILFVPSHLRLCLFSGHWTKFVYVCFVSLVRAACLVHLNFHLTTPTRLVKIIIYGSPILTFNGPWVVIYSYSNTNQMHQFLKLFIFA
jgi:hypothetical protein